MDLQHIFNVLLRRKWLLTLGILVGLGLAMQTLPKSYTTYETSTTLLLDTPQFTVGRAGLDVEDNSFSRTIALAPVYSALITSDLVLAKAQKKMTFSPEALTAQPVENAPLIRLSVQGSNAQQVQKTASLVANTFIDNIEELQEENEVPSKDRILVSVLSKPTFPTQTGSRKWEIAFLVFVTPVAASVAVAFVLENLADTAATRSKI